jgi:hypothetical protein
MTSRHSKMLVRFVLVSSVLLTWAAAFAAGSPSWKLMHFQTGEAAQTAPARAQ